MNQMKRMLRGYGFAHSLGSIQLCRAQSIHKQVNLFSQFRPLLFTNIQFLASGIRNQLHFLSSTPESVLSLFSSEDWQNNFDKVIRDSSLPLTHETVMFILRRLSESPEKASRFFKCVVDESGFKPSSSIYSLMLRIYASKGFLKEFWVLIKEMKEKGYYLDEETYRTIFSTFRGSKMENEATALKHFHGRLIKENATEELVKEVVDVIKNTEWSEQVERKLEKMKIAVSDNFVLRVLKELRGKGYLLKACKFFKWVDKSLGFQHNSVTYNGMLRVLCWEDSITEFWSVMEEMKRAGFDMDIDTYIKITRQLQKNRMLKDAVRLHEHMMDSPFKPSCKECSMLLRTIATHPSPDLDLVFKVVEIFEAAGYSMSKIVYDGIHRSLTNLGKFDEANKIVEKMKSEGFEPDNITYSQLVFGLCKASRCDEASTVLTEMEKQGCNPDTMTWTILIKGHCIANQVDKAMLCFAKMMEKGFDADADLIDVLVCGFLSQNRAIGAYTLLLELVKTVRSRPWQATYKNLIETLLGERKFEEALQLLHMMKKQKYPPFSEPFVRYISKYGSVDDAQEFLKTLTVKEYPSIRAYQHVFRSFFNEDRHSEARDLLFRCPHHIRKHQAVTSLFDSAT